MLKTKYEYISLSTNWYDNEMNLISIKCLLHSFDKNFDCKETLEKIKNVMEKDFSITKIDNLIESALKCIFTSYKEYDYKIHYTCNCSSYDDYDTYDYNVFLAYID